MAIIDVKKSMVFDGIRFPVMELVLTGGIRRHTHLFPYSPGGPTELMARDNYKIKVKSVFCDSYKDYGAELYPTNLALLRRKFESQVIGSLDVPNLGVIKAYAHNWNFTMTHKIQNGEDVDIQFEEDTTDLFSVDKILTQRASGFQFANESFGGLIDEPEFKTDIFDQIFQVANTVQSFIDTGELVNSLIAAQIDALSGLLQRAADDVELIKNPENLEMIEAFKTLWASTIDLKETIDGAGILRPYTVFKDSTLAEVCIATYGDTTKASEILTLNHIPDPFLIPEGTVIVYRTLSAGILWLR